jgi:hypothetical protein
LTKPLVFCIRYLVGLKSRPIFFWEKRRKEYFMLPDLLGSQSIHGIVTIPREGTSPISLSAWKDEGGVHFFAPGRGAQEITLSAGTVFEFHPEQPSEEAPIV